MAGRISDTQKQFCMIRFAVLVTLSAILVGPIAYAGPVASCPVRSEPARPAGVNPTITGPNGGATVLGNGIRVHAWANSSYVVVDATTDGVSVDVNRTDTRLPDGSPTNLQVHAHASPSSQNVCVADPDRGVGFSAPS